MDTLKLETDYYDTYYTNAKKRGDGVAYTYLPRDWAGKKILVVLLAKTCR